MDLWNGETMLVGWRIHSTGESVPVLKNSVSETDSNSVYDAASDRRHTLFCGTAVLQTRAAVGQMVCD